MKLARFFSQFLLVACLGSASALVCAASPATEEQRQIDWNRAREIYGRFQKGETISSEDKAYLDRARAEQNKSRGAPANPEPPRTSTGLIPLDQMTAGQKYKGEDGGLYGGGKNQPPPQHQKAAETERSKIVPLDSDGQPKPDGKIVLLSIGMSNTTQEFSKFKELADRDPDKSPALVIVDGAQGGKDAAAWSDETTGAAVWILAETRLRAAGAAPAQVQVVWLKQARINPARYGDYPKHAEELKAHTVSILQIAKKRYTNLRIAYLSSRIYAGYASTPLNPEPFAYEGAFAVRSIILDQINGATSLNYNPTKGEVRAPLVLWGPYLWSDGLTPRQSDGLVWKREDLGGDGTHPSPGPGREKVAVLLLHFLKSDAYAKPWFLRPSGVQMN